MTGEAQAYYTPIASGQKVGVIGAGAVGSACAFALLLRRSCGEIVLVDRDRKRAAGVAADMRYGEPLSRAAVVRDGGYDDLADADVVLITAGVNEKSGGATDRGDAEGRLKLVEVNAGVYRDIVPQVTAVAPDAVLVAVTDPPDPLAALARELAGHAAVISTGTLLDSLRFRLHIATRLRVDPISVEANVIGEHGTSQVLLWSSATVAGIPVERLLADRYGADAVPELKQHIDRDVRYANITIIEGNNASQYGIGAACARISEAILGDEHVVLPVSSYNEAYDATIALPSTVGRRGVLEIFEPEMTADERRDFERSADTIRAASERVGVPARTHTGTAA